MHLNIGLQAELVLNYKDSWFAEIESDKGILELSFIENDEK